MKQPAQARSEQDHTTAAAKTATRRQSASAVDQFVDNRQVAVAQRQLADFVAQSPRMTAQRAQMAMIGGAAIQRAGGVEEELPMQGKAIQRVGGVEEELPAQGKAIQHAAQR